MAGNSFGTLFKITTFGESRGGGVGVIVDGCPPGLELNDADIQVELDRRKPGIPRDAKDVIKIYSGIFNGKTTGTPIMIMAMNAEAKSEDHEKLSKYYRPSHADYTYEIKYGIRDWHGSGRASARETLARVSAGAIAKKYLAKRLNIEVLSYVEQIGAIKTDLDHEKVTSEDIESNIVRCPDDKVAKKMIARIEEVRGQGDSLGGVIRGMIRNVPAGLGEPVFDKISAELAKAMMGINSVKGFEIGSGFSGASLTGSKHNDEFYMAGNKVRTRSNNSGGTLGGITNGETIHFRVAFKPLATIVKEQNTVTVDGKDAILAAPEHHDPCILPRAIPIIDAMSALVVIDHYLIHQAYSN